MQTILILLVLATMFVLLAVKYWSRDFKAGPMILIIGAVVIASYVPIKWTTYQGLVRDYDTCAGRVERSQATNKFNSVLIGIITRYSDGSDESKTIIKELQDATPEPLVLTEDCPAEPRFWSVFFNGGNERFVPKDHSDTTISTATTTTLPAIP